MAKFLSYLVIKDITDDIWELHEPLIYESDILGRIEVPVGFQTDLASVPKVPLVYEAWGNRSHYEAVIHDWLYRIDSVPQATFDQANDVFLEAMEVRGKPWYIRKPMYWGVCIGGRSSYHKRKVGECLTEMHG
jgi:hypothetical protein